MSEEVARMLCDPAFRPVVEAFREGIGAGGAALAITAGGRIVVDVWHGTRDEAGTLPWERDTVVNVFSVSKSLVTTLAHVLVRRGLLDLDAPVSAYWPAFRTRTTVADLLAHRAGLPALRDPMPEGSAYDWDAMTAALAAEPPWWEPGTRHGYHAVTFGWLVGEVLRRATGTSVRDLVTAELGPDLHIGLPAHAERRAASVLPPEGSAGVAPAPGPVALRAFTNPADLLVPGAINTPAARRAQIPAVNGHATARALAALHGGLADLLGSDVLARATAPRSDGPDEVLGGRTRFGLGYMLPNEVRPFAPNPRAFGHTGAGGSLAFADPDLGIGLGYVTNRVLISPAGPDPRWTPLLEALYR
ncbi:CubicO group peptidase (beta-lactamase class C family) [Saccharothrix coeruleofusca]|uniref:serine hydrolase domain-containing protein n=1 Tax=Saccharothrix coeruleofusca TaxID=33919 RepID=UPI001AE2D6A2|nr:serine hydrolase domain-containing protein [Saccharothrix coeruleofusca]MBP2336672.1 CubicO group peptidase (beta-lactamase class C family) [Saccharothrix coeruleofusca]